MPKKGTRRRSLKGGTRKRSLKGGTRKRSLKGGTRKRSSNGGMRKRKSKAVCQRETLKRYRTRPSPPYRAAFCAGKIMKGNDGNMYISKRDFAFSPPRWVRV